MIAQQERLIADHERLIGEYERCLNQLDAAIQEKAKLRAMIARMLRELDENLEPYEGTYLDDGTETEARALLDYSE